MITEQMAAGLAILTVLAVILLVLRLTRPNDAPAKTDDLPPIDD